MTETHTEAVTVTVTQDELDNRKILSLLHELGGGKVGDDDLTFEGDKLILPETMSPKDAISYLERHLAQNETETNFTKTFRFRPLDGAHATQQALKKVFGTAGIGKTQFSFFGKIPPQLREIRTGVDSTEQVPWGQLEVPSIEGYISFGGQNDPEFGMLYSVQVTTKRKYRSHVMGLFAAIQNELENSSIYKGKAIDGREDPEFLDLRTLDESKIIFADDVIDQLEAHVWSLIEDTERQEAMGLPMKRAVLLEGPFGTGKSSALWMTAKKAMQHGWTFVMCRPGRDSLTEVMETARLYQPAVVVFEDVDTIAQNGDPEAVTKLLDLFDGINAKNTKLLAMMTTNNVDDIHKGMIRPGRLDSVIRIAELDRGGVERMVRVVVKPEMLSETVDYDRVFDAMEGFLPAFIKESIERAVRHALVRTKGDADISHIKLDTEDFILAANGLRPQLDLMNSAGMGKTMPTLDRAIREAVADVVHNADLTDEDGDKPSREYPAVGVKVRGSKNGYGSTNL
jgi:transitional endoplasmic reticulum ATPase